VPRLPHATAVVVALVLLTAAPAAAFTLEGSVVGRPESRGTVAVIPLLLDAQTVRDQRLTGTVVRAVVRQPAGLRTLAGPIGADDLRLGDRVRATGAVLGVTARRARRPRVRIVVLRVGRRSAIASFRTLDEALLGTASAVGAATAALVAAPASGAAAPPGDPLLRTELGDLRFQLDLLRADLERFVSALDAARTALAGEAAVEPARRRTARLERRALERWAGQARNRAQAAVTSLGAVIVRLDDLLLTDGADPAPPSAPGALQDLTAALTTVGQLVGGVDLPTVPPLR